MPSARALSLVEAGPSGRLVEESEADSKEIEVVYSEEAPGNVEAVVLQGNEGVEPVVESHPDEGMLLKNPRSTVTKEEVKLWRYLYKIPSSVEIQVLKAHEMVDWVVPG